MTRTLMYHDVVAREARETAGFTGPLAARYKLEPDAFEAHLRALAELAPRVGTLDGAVATDAPAADAPAVDASAPAAGAPQVVLSFDDGGRSALDAALALERHGWRGQFFITTARIDTPGFLTREQVRELAARGHAIGSHSHTHPTYMGRLTRAELDREWSISRALLEELLGEAPRSASVPGGYLSREVVRSAAAAGYELLFTSEPTARVREDAIAVHGRYTIWASTDARVAAAYARGERVACGRLWLEWNAKKLAKRVSPSAYQRLRRVRARNA